MLDRESMMFSMELERGALKVVTEDSCVTLDCDIVAEVVPFLGVRYFSAAPVLELNLRFGLRKEDL